jgi:hypothetical protein
VIVNPAHSEADLAFAHAVGLPVRFALAPKLPTANPETWVTPPYVAAGVAVRTGVADGTPAAQARGTYLEALQAAGSAVRFTDRVLGALRVQEAARPGSDASVPGPGLVPDVAAVLAGPLEDGATFVVTRASLARLLLLRALHVDLHGCDIPNPQVVVVAQVTGQPPERFPDGIVDLASVCIARNEETAALKPAQLEQVERFVDNHERLREAPGDASPVLGKRTERILRDIREGRFSEAFAELYKVQRDLKKNPDLVITPDGHAYFALAYVLAALEPPAGYNIDEVLREPLQTGS